MLTFIRALSVLVLVIFAINAAAVVLLLAIAAGLMFRTKQTLALLSLFAVLAALTAHPGIGLLAVVAFVIVLWLENRKPKPGEAHALPPSRS
jgi:hypothetical protein